MAIRTFTLLFFLLSCDIALAQGGIRNASNWKYTGRTQIPVKMYQSFPSICRPALARAVATYNAQRSVLEFTHSPTVLSSNNLETTRDNDLVISYAMGFTNPDIVAETRYTWSSSSTRNTYGPGFLVTDTDILVNFNKLFYGGSTTSTYGEFFCPSAGGQATPSTKLDFETVVLHELTHAAGLSHFDPTSCVVYDTITGGSTRRSYCTQEATYLRGLYGTR